MVGFFLYPHLGRLGRRIGQHHLQVEAPYWLFKRVTKWRWFNYVGGLSGLIEECGLNDAHDVTMHYSHTYICKAYICKCRQTTFVDRAQQLYICRQTTLVNIVQNIYNYKQRDKLVIWLMCVAQQCAQFVLRKAKFQIFSVNFI